MQVSYLLILSLWPAKHPEAYVYAAGALHIQGCHAALVRGQHGCSPVYQGHARPGAMQMPGPTFQDPRSHPGVTAGGTEAPMRERLPMHLPASGSIWYTFLPCLAYCMALERDASMHSVQYRGSHSVIESAALHVHELVMAACKASPAQHKVNSTLMPSAGTLSVHHRHT